MFLAAPRLILPSVIEIEFESQEPPQGWVREAGRRPKIRFAGWVGLVQAVSEVVRRASSDVPGGLGRELGARRDGQLAEDTPQMRRDRTLRDEEVPADLAV